MPMSQCSPAHGQTESRKRATTFTTSSFLEKARLTAQLHMWKIDKPIMAMFMYAE